MHGGYVICCKTSLPGAILFVFPAMLQIKLHAFLARFTVLNYSGYFCELLSFPY